MPQGGFSVGSCNTVRSSFGLMRSATGDLSPSFFDRIVANLQTHFQTLTPREREILALVSSGLMNKQIAAELGLAEITVKIHRGHIMKKMDAKSLADLLRKAETLGVRRVKP